MPRARGMAAYVRDGYGEFRQPEFEFGYCEMLVFRVCGLRQNLYVFSFYRNPNLPPRTVMELQLLTSQLSPVAISWLSAQPMHVMEHLTS